MLLNLPDRTGHVSDGPIGPTMKDPSKFLSKVIGDFEKVYLLLFCDTEYDFLAVNGEQIHLFTDREIDLERRKVFYSKYLEAFLFMQMKDCNRYGIGVKEDLGDSQAHYLKRIELHQRDELVQPLKEFYKVDDLLGGAALAYELMHEIRRLLDSHPDGCVVQADLTSGEREVQLGVFGKESMKDLDGSYCVATIENFKEKFANR